ncbi:universal stress protein [Massilia sp. SYSU DXS3249]
MKKLLVPCDGSDNALHAVRHAAREAADAQAQVHLLHVVEPMTPVILAEAFSAPQLDDRFPPQAAQALEPAAKILVEAGVPYTLHCHFGLPAPEIAGYAHSTACDAIIMGTRGRGALANLMIGSVATQVVKLVDIPVTLVKQAWPPRRQDGDVTKKILVPIDGSDSALRALRHAAARAREKPGVRLELLHVLDPTSSRSYASLSPAELTRLAPDEFVRVLGPARELLDSEGIPYEVHCRTGDPGRQIGHHLAQAGSAAVVMGTRGLGLMGNLVIGSVASQVVYHAQVPVTLIK